MATRTIAAAAVAALLLGGPAAAHVTHTVEPGESLWSIAAAKGVSPQALAAANGLHPEAHVLAGSALGVPGASAGAAPQAPPPMGGYVVQPGDTLSGLAARSGIALGRLAAMNGLAPDGDVVAGMPLKLPTGAPNPAPAPAAPAPASAPVAQAPPVPAPGRVGASDIQTIAAQHGVPGSLAAAIGWQESGFENSMVSSANARGVMQILPGTWDWVQQNLAGAPLDPASAADNVHAGVLYLRRLLADTGGDPGQAAAAYYQGLSSVRRIGMLPETRRYVANVLALRSRFGGG